MAKKNKPTVVLVHGAFADASGWNGVIERLQEKKVDVTAPANPLRGISIDSAYTAAVFDETPGPVLAVGHSYGGAVITNAAKQAKNVVGLVYVAAFAPDEGETVADVFYRTEPHPQAPKLAPDDHGLIYLPEAAFAAAFAQHASAEELTLLAAVQRPIAPACITVALDRPLWKDRPSWFLVAEEDRMIVPETQHFMAARMKARVRGASSST